jgi:hypothetical protein
MATTKFSAAHVVQQVAEIFITEWIIAEVLNEASTVGIGMRLIELVFGCLRKSLL